MESKDHNKNLNFEKNLVAASGGKILEEAAPLWRFSHFGAEDDGYTNCQLCHSRMKLWIAIRNSENAVVLLIGHDCYDKLLAFLVTKKVGSLSLGERKKYLNAIKRYCKRHITESFLSWLAEQDAPTEIKVTAEFIKKFGYAPTLEAAEALVIYYKVNRRFKLRELLDHSRRSEVVRQLFVDFLDLEVSLLEYERFDLGFADGISWDEMDDGFFKAAFHKSYPEGAALSEILSSGARMTELIQKARGEVGGMLEDAWKRAVIQLQERIATNQDNYKLLTFWQGENLKRGTKQWESRESGKKYVLDKTCSYNPDSGPVFVRITRELVPNRVYLVSKLNLVPSTVSPRYAWVTG